MLRAIRRWLFDPSCVVYVATKMTGRDRTEMVDRAMLVCNVLAAKGLLAISPVLEEGVTRTAGPLRNEDEAFLQKKWKADKFIIRRVAHVCLFDGADEGSVGMAREYGLSRWCLWKPTIILWNNSRGLTVGEYEDDRIVYTVQAAASVIASHWLCRWDRIKWRVQLLKRTFPKWIGDQLYAIYQ